MKTLELLEEENKRLKKKIGELFKERDELYDKYVNKDTLRFRNKGKDINNDIELLNNLRMGWGWECGGCGKHEMNCKEYCCPEDADERDWFCMKDDMTAMAERLGLYWNKPLEQFIKKG